MEFVCDMGERRILLSEGDVYYVPRLATYSIEYNSDIVFTAVHFNFHSKTELAAFRNADIQRLSPDEDMRCAIKYIYENIKCGDSSFGVMSRLYRLMEDVSKRLVKSSTKQLDERIVKAMSMLEEGKIHFVGSDCHNTTSRCPRIGKAFEIIETVNVTFTYDPNGSFAGFTVIVNDGYGYDMCER